MIKQIIVTACFFLTLASFAQSGSASPYSYFGIGESRFKGNLENRSMSGVAIEQDSIHINILNPASFAAIRLTTFTMGGGYTSTKMKSDKGDAKAQRTTLDYLAVALPLGKMGVGFGLLPYSSVGYKIESLSSDPNGNNNRLTGSGGLNKAFFALGYTIIPNLVVGADIQYNFGRIKNSNLEFITAIPIGTQEENKADLSGFSTNFGVMYQGKINKKLNYYGSATYMPGSTLASNNTRTISTVQYDANFNLGIVDVVDAELIRKDIKIPEKITFGAGIGQSRKWLVGTQIVYQNIGGSGNGVNDSKNVTYENYSNYSLGGYYIPNYNMFSKYYQKITYRAGLKYGKTGTIINSKSIDETGITLGFGLPSVTGGSLSNFNIGLEYGKRGTTSNGLIQENYGSISLSFSLNDKWFRQSKFN
ncbi:hypothetical protein FNW52_11220 [Flavobacterium sp. ZT3R18]|uniref:hypothetical protein n=1 Tax=Flavobacterium sp. ZT3R18 TaxID=2594429 RepID=UPI001179EDEA|nr:hypothetical protein [Flavobacterium sp. ZT3R18]TRX35284.1 hypothetical protein FNW52_11220 [Flavobacterium sp. ZT3R18]